ncbi:histone-lysine N-methyltransferase SETMAR-like [Argiope bruennichi]|uniref:histone-lysine N-methyltransferase SETMAR-like n=1 Tax=Argiope bruennichi TaxID=94029 RepID=UPI002494D1F7|nr:histone-lysine N-methyltransferase SETMAR-like [Argiope bruennichi]
MTFFLEDISDHQENIKIPFINERNCDQLPTFVYTPHCVLKTESLLKDFESISLPCDCENICSEKCPCSSNAYYDGKLSKNYDNNTSKPIIECSDMCSCVIKCNNRIVQHGIQFPLQVFLTDRTGFGVRSTEFIPELSFVCEYAGEIIDESEAYRRLKSHTPDESNYIYVLKEHSSDNKHIQTIIDPTCIGNVGRFLNHSCSPNLFSVPIRAGSMIPRICFFAKKDILPFQELTYNYGGHCTFKKSDSRPVELRARKCLCYSSDCCGHLPFVENNWLK